MTNPLRDMEKPDVIFAIGTNSVYLDVDTRTMIAQGPPKELRDHSNQPTVRKFLTRGEENHYE